MTMAKHALSVPTRLNHYNDPGWLSSQAETEAHQQPRCLVDGFATGPECWIGIDALELKAQAQGPPSAQVSTEPHTEPEEGLRL